MVLKHFRRSFREICQDSREVDLKHVDLIFSDVYQIVDSDIAESISFASESKLGLTFGFLEKNSETHVCLRFFDMLNDLKYPTRVWDRFSKARESNVHAQKWSFMCLNRELKIES